MTLPILELLEQIRDRDPNAWPELVRLYRPLILRWLQSCQVSESDAEDISQEVLIQVLRLIDDFEHNGRVGAFRNWLRAVTHNVMRNHLRKAEQHETWLSDKLRFTVTALSSDSSDATRQFNREHDRMIVERLLGELNDEVSLRAMTIFRRYCLLEESAESVAADLAISVNCVYVTRVRVLQKLRAKSELLDDIGWSSL
ncbi:MAG: sigma-70 family RNA polymerase sigma factor [Planctomycetaceae bacterium]|nr:sigma-70 family RNA polymerase sigma factor [Planctomycetaceae bacterium]